MLQRTYVHYNMEIVQVHILIFDIVANICGDIELLDFMEEEP